MRVDFYLVRLTLRILGSSTTLLTTTVTVLDILPIEVTTPVCIVGMLGDESEVGVGVREEMSTAMPCRL